MKRNYKKFSLLEKAGMARILIVLNDVNYMLTTTLQEQVGVSSESYYNARNYLEDLGLIERYDIDLGKIKPFRITEKGKEIGSLLKKAEELLIKDNF